MWRDTVAVINIFLLFLAVAAPAETPGAPRNIILMITDGAGFNAFHACSYYQHGQLGHQVYDGFPVRLACTTYMLNEDGIPQGYDPKEMWSDFNYVKGDNDYTCFTGSAAAATALNTGVKTTMGRVNTDLNDHRLMTLAEVMAEEGKSVGVVTSVPVSHATPACVWAHNESRFNYKEIAREMIYGSGLTVIMGAGHPWFDNDGHTVPPGILPYKFVGGKRTWQAICRGTTGEGWTFIQHRGQFEVLAANPAVLPDRVIGIAQVHSTLQYKRDGTAMGMFNMNVPTLETMTRAAINVVSRNPEGFFLMVEGGAVDWANHDHNVGRMIEELIDFNRSIEAVVEWIEENGGWSESLLIITADHETGMMWGPGTYIDSNGNGNYDDGVDTFVDWQPVENRGRGILPAVQYGSRSHTNTLVPLFANGAGAHRFRFLLDGFDMGAGLYWGIKGFYADNTDLFHVMNR